jgi:hypothetical protein
MALLLITIVAIAIVMLGMSVGVLFGRPCLRGSCGGVGRNGEDLSCETCPLRRARPDEAA